MAAFVFVVSESGAPIDLSDATRAGVLGALRERSPGPIHEREGEGFWAALAGPHGELMASGNRVLLVDGVAEVGGSQDAVALLATLDAARAEGGTHSDPTTGSEVSHRLPGASPRVITTETPAGRS